MNEQQVLDTYTLIQAVRKDKAAALALLQQYPELLEQKTKHVEETALHYLVIEDSRKEVTFLLEQGADINTVDSAGDTPLISACMLGHQHMMELLLASGARVNHADNRNYTALHYAAERCDVEIITLLLAAGADKNIKAFLNEETPIDLAKETYVKVLELLEDAHA